MNEQDTIKTLEANGGKLWEKNNMRRVYFNPEIAMSLDVSRYNTGNISGATCDGMLISNAEAYRALNVKMWFDLVDGQFHTKNAESLHRDCRAALEAFTEKMRAAIA